MHKMQPLQPPRLQNSHRSRPQWQQIYLGASPWEQLSHDAPEWKPAKSGLNQPDAGSRSGFRIQRLARLTTRFLANCDNLSLTCLCLCKKFSRSKVSSSASFCAVPPGVSSQPRRKHSAMIFCSQFVLSISLHLQELHLLELGHIIK